MKDVMIDLETFGTSSRAAIASIGAVEFDRSRIYIPGEPSTYDSLGERFKVGVSLPSALAAGGVVDASTLVWWFGQPEAQKAWLGLTHEPLPRALELLRGWFKRTKADCVWANGSNFDLPILDSAYHALGTKSPWHYRAARDLRTLGDMADVNVLDWQQAVESAKRAMAPDPYLAHDPLCDAVVQAIFAQIALVRLDDRQRAD